MKPGYSSGKMWIWGEEIFLPFHKEFPFQQGMGNKKFQPVMAQSQYIPRHRLRILPPLCCNKPKPMDRLWFWIPWQTCISEQEYGTYNTRKHKILLFHCSRSFWDHKRADRKQFWVDDTGGATGWSNLLRKVSGLPGIFQNSWTTMSFLRKQIEWTHWNHTGIHWRCTWHTSKKKKGSMWQPQCRCVPPYSHRRVACLAAKIEKKQPGSL